MSVPSELSRMVFEGLVGYPSTRSAGSGGIVDKCSRRNLSESNDPRGDVGEPPYDDAEYHELPDCTFNFRVSEYGLPGSSRSVPPTRRNRLCELEGAGGDQRLCDVPLEGLC